MIDADDEPARVVQYFDGRGVAHQGYGNGITFANRILGASFRWSLEHACGIRMQTGRPRFIYVWTVNVDEEMREYIRIGVDGIITDSPLDDIKAVINEPEFKHVVRLATRADNPFRPANFGYALHVHTADKYLAGTDANLTFTLTGATGSTSKKINADLINRMEPGYWNWVTLQSRNLGKLTSVTVQRDDTNSLDSDWFLDRIDVHSARYGSGGQAFFNIEIDSTAPFTRKIV